MIKRSIIVSTLALILAASPVLAKDRHHGSPKVVMERHGQGHVLVGSSCIVYYDRHGDRKRSNRDCSHGDRARADRAMESYRRRHHRERRPYLGNSYGITVLQLRNGRYQATVSGTCTAYFNRKGGLMTWLPGCTIEDRANASVAVLQYRRNQ